MKLYIILISLFITLINTNCATKKAICNTCPQNNGMSGYK